MSEKRVEIPGSTPPHRPQSQLANTDPNQEVQATIILRRHQPAGDLEQRLFSGQFQPISREQAEEILGADPHDLHAVRTLAQQYRLHIIDEKPDARTLCVSGAVRDMNAAFGIQLGWFQGSQGEKYLSYDGPITVPEELAGVIIAVLGLDQRPIAKRH